MLYISTRCKEDTYTVHRALTCEQAPDGGRFVPFHMPAYSAEELAQLEDKSFSQTVADVLNMFFSSRLNGWDLDISIGRNIFRIVPMNHKIVLVELWHNLEGKFSYVENALFQTLTVGKEESFFTDWVRISVRIAILFGLYGEMLRNNILEPGHSFDISVPNDAFVMPMAAWYSRAMGLPLNMIICCCSEDNNIWEFIHRGVLSTPLVPKELASGLERLLQGTLGCDEANKFCLAYHERKPYSVSEEALAVLNRGLFCSVAGKDRAQNTINSVFRSNSYIITPGAALCYSGLQDYRARTGESSLTVILAERTPMDYSKTICDATGISADKLYDHINRG